MNAVTVGLFTGIALTFIGLQFGFGAFMLATFLGGVGALIGAIATRRIDVVAAFNAARGRSVA